MEKVANNLESDKSWFKKMEKMYCKLKSNLVPQNVFYSRLGFIIQLLLGDKRCCNAFYIFYLYQFSRYLFGKAVVSTEIYVEM